MASVSHLYLVMEGNRTNTVLQGETWQSGVRLALDASFDLAPVGDIPTGLNTETRETAYTGTLGTVESNFAVTKFNEDFDPADYLENVVAVAGQDLIRKSGAAIAATARLTGFRLYAIGFDGKVCQTDLGPAKAKYTYTTSIVGTASGDPLPPFVCSAISLYTPNKTKRGRGRMYTPALGEQATDPDGMLSSSVRGALAAGYAAYLNALKLDQGLSLPWVSNISLRPVVIGNPWRKYFGVDEVRVGSVFDTQRRRKNQINEEYTRLAL